MERDQILLNNKLNNTLKELTKIKKRYEELLKKQIRLEEENKKLKNENEMLRNFLNQNKIQLTISNIKSDKKISNEWVCLMGVFPSGNIISVSRDKSIKIYNKNLEIRPSIQDIPNAHDDDINYVEIIDENNFITCSNDKSIKIWNKKKNKFMINQIIQNAHNDGIMKVIYCSNGDLISCSINGPIIIWKEKKNQYIKIKQLSQDNNIRDLLLLEDKNMFISGGENGIIFWNFNQNNLDCNNIYSIHYIKELYCERNNSMCRLDDDRIIINGSKKGLLKVISISKKEIINDNIPIPFLCYGIKLIKNKGIFLVGGKNIFGIRVYRSDNYECIQKIENPYDDDIYGFIELNDGNIASYSNEGQIIIWKYI